MEIMKDKRVSVKLLFILLIFLSCIYLSCSAPTPFKDISSEVTETTSLDKTADFVKRNATTDQAKDMVTGRPYNFDTLDVRKATLQNFKKQNFEKNSRKTKGKLLLKSIPEYHGSKDSLDVLNSSRQNENIQYITSVPTMTASLTSVEEPRIINSDNIDVHKKSSISFIPNILPSILTYIQQTTTTTTTKSTTTPSTTRKEPTLKTTTATTTTSPTEELSGGVGITNPKLQTTLTLPVVTKTSPKDDFISTKDIPAVTLYVDDSKAQDITSSAGAQNASSTSSIVRAQQPSSLMLTTIPITSVDVDEKIIKSIDVEKIDLKSMKEYQSRIISTEGGVSPSSTQSTPITTRLPPPSSSSSLLFPSSTTISTTTPEYFANVKKKVVVGGIVMGHDGIKVTKKKQLIEKIFKDDENLMRKSKGFSLDNIDEQKIEIGDVHKMKTNKKYHPNVTSGHLGPLIFKERVIEEHGNKENLFFNNKPENTSTTKTTTTTQIPIIKTEITSTELIKTENEFLLNLPNDNYDFFANLQKRNDTQYETERLRKISEFFPTNASLSEIFRSRTGFIVDNFENIDRTTTVRVPIDEKKPEIDITTINTIFDIEENFKMEKLDQDIAYSRDGGHESVERIVGNIKNQQPPELDITTINFNDAFLDKERSQSEIDITTTNLNDAIMNFQDGFKDGLKSEIDITTTKLNDELLNRPDANMEIDLITRNFNGTLVVEGIRTENNPITENLNAQVISDGSNSEIVITTTTTATTTNLTEDTQNPESSTTDFQTSTTTYLTSKETFQTETISTKFKELTTTSSLESTTHSESILYPKTPLTTLNTDASLPPGTTQDTRQFNQNLQTLNKTIKKDTETSRIEIEINVSEGNGNFTSDLMQFSFSNSQPGEVLKSVPQFNSSKQKIEQIGFQKNSNSDLITLKPVDIVQNEFFNETDILVVEITDGENTTDNYYNNENLPILNENPKYANHDYDTKNSKNFQDYGEYNLKSPGSRESNSEDDDLFVPDLKLEPYEDLIPITASSGSSNNGIPGGPPAYQKDSIDRDSDTIFYISNTEVKVVESVPTPNTNTDGHSDPKLQSTENFSIHQGHHRISKLESQFFPAIYEEDVIIDFPGKNSTNEGKYSDRYQEDIILSPLKNNFDPLKIIRNRSGVHHSFNDEISRSNPSGGSFSSSDDNMSVSYIAESFIDVEESPGSSTPSRPPSLEVFNRKEHENDRTQSSYSDANENPSISSDVIIQPAIIPEISIGVPVIGELPPQIELKEIDFIPNGNTNSNNNNNNNDDSIQYGGDLIANIGGRGVGDGYDIETGYAFGGSAKIRENVGGIGGDNDVTVTSQIVMHAVDNLQKDQLMAEIPGEGAGGYKNLPAKRNGNSTGPENFRNATADSVLDDNDGDLNFTDIQTLFLACFATLVPLILSVLLAFGLRYLWMKYRRDPSSTGGLVGDNSTDPLAAKSMTLSQDELKSTESGYTINRSNDTLESSTEIVTKYDGSGGGITVNGTATTNMLNHSGANGSVITMTLKNNHLIVETEERNDISRDARETKMHYTPSEKDGVFVVEVARGVDSTGAPESPRKDSDSRKNNYTLDIDTIEKPKAKDCKTRNHEEVQIHQPPNDDDVLVEVDENNISQKSETAANLGSSNTGLSQSDLSTSSGDSNKGYTYGNQKLYTVDTEDCRPHSPKVKIASPVYSPNECENGDCSGENDGDRDSNPKSDPETKPVITAALLKQDTVIEVTDRGSKCPKLDKKPEENGNPGDKEAADEKLHQEQQHQLGNGEISPLDNGPTNETENGFDSIISLPAPPSTEEIKQMNDVILMENSQLDSLPPPPPPENQSQTVTTHDIPLAGVPTEGQNGVAVVAVTGSS